MLTLVPGDRALGEEGYRLRVDDRVAIAARRPAGLFWGTQTLRQLLPPAIESREPVAGRWLVPRGTIHDRPRFAWRGLMLDVARHFFGVEELERLVDQMALYKLNRLHLHLTDDQGWRLAIRSWPNLTRLGGARAVGGGAGGHLTQRQYARIVAYARRRFVDVVPEIDMPGTSTPRSRRTPADGRRHRPRAVHGDRVGFSSLAIRKERRTSSSTTSCARWPR